MITILLEQPVPILIAGLLLAAATGVAFVSTGRMHFAVATLVVLLITAGLLGLEWYVVTEREEVETALFQMAADIEANDVDAILGHISAQSADVRSEAAAAIAIVKISSFSIKTNTLDIEVNSSHRPPLAVATFNLVVSGRLKIQGADSTYPAFIELKLRRESDGVWRVTNYDWYDFTEGMKSEGKRKRGGSKIPVP